MSGGKGTHSTENRVEKFAAIDAALAVLTPGETAAVRRAEFLTELHEQRHVVGHETDRHHELLRLCTEFVDRWDRLDRPRPCIGCQHIVGRPDDTHADGCPIPGIRAVVANPLRGEP